MKRFIWSPEINISCFVKAPESCITNHRRERGGRTEIYFVEMLPKTLKLHFVSAGLEGGEEVKGHWEMKRKIEEFKVGKTWLREDREIKKERERSKREKE